MTQLPTYKSHPDDHWIDEIRITTAPRYKTSELSGDEWRFSHRIVLMRKGREVAEHRVNDLRYAAVVAQQGLYLVDFEMEALGWRTLMTPHDFEVLGLCMNPGCPEVAKVEYRLKKLYSRDGSHEQDMFGAEYRRRFCYAHSTRGDCGREDNDDNYELISGKRVRPDPADVTESTRVDIDMRGKDLATLPDAIADVLSHPRAPLREDET